MKAGLPTSVLGLFTAFKHKRCQQHPETCIDCLIPPGSIGNPSHHLRQDTVPVRHTVADHICKNHRHI